jgi:HAD superfamily hydrolase (TIGR01662 family)
MPITAVLFDMFDTLMIIEKDHAFYSPAVKGMHAYLTKNGIQVTFPAFRDAYIRARDQLYEAADPTMEEPHFNLRVKHALEDLGFKKESDSHIVQGATDAFCGEFMNYIRIDEDAVPVLKELHKRYRLGIVSNFAIPECVVRLLRQHKIDKLFETIVISATVNKRKPHPQIFQHALNVLRLEPSEVAFVGDTVDADVKGAKEAGMKTVYVERRPQKELEINKPDQTIKALSELPSVLKKL